MKRKFDMHKFRRDIMNDEYRYYFQLLCISFVLGLVSLGMGVLNIFTKKELLMWATLSFGFVFEINAVMLYFFKKAKLVNYLIFEISIIALLTYFLITGGTAGFSPHWIVLLPSFGMLFIGQKRGLIISCIMYGITIVLLYTPLRYSLVQYEFSDEFCMRFPIVYGVFFAVGIIFEYLRSLTNRLLKEAQAKLSEAVVTDALTKIHNRRWLNEIIAESYEGNCLRSDCLFILADIDNFKKVNDIYGHAIGDEALIMTAQTLHGAIRSTDYICRWGGEEFLAFLPDCREESVSETCERLRNAVAQNPLRDKDGNEFHISISIGATVLKKGTVLDSEAVFNEVDRLLYVAKANGKNRVEISR